jgi:hypothetical protein
VVLKQEKVCIASVRMQGPQANVLENKIKIADCVFIDLKCAPKQSDIYSHIAYGAEAYKNTAKEELT